MNEDLGELVGIVVAYARLSNTHFIGCPEMDVLVDALLERGEIKPLEKEHGAIWTRSSSEIDTKNLRKQAYRWALRETLHKSFQAQISQFLGERNTPTERRNIERRLEAFIEESRHMAAVNAVPVEVHCTSDPNDPTRIRVEFELNKQQRAFEQLLEP